MACQGWVSRAWGPTTSGELKQSGRITGMGMKGVRSKCAWQLTTPRAPPQLLQAAVDSLCGSMWGSWICVFSGYGTWECADAKASCCAEQEMG